MELQQGVQIVKLSKDRKYQLDEDVLNRVLFQEDIMDFPVVVVSIAGAYRGGKSFMLDYILRYIYYKYDNKNTEATTEWLGDDNEPLKGFSWRGGSDRDTCGILIWSQPITVCLPSGEKVVILLMDTQGMFDSSSTVRECSTIFALSTLLSSVQIYNLSHNIKEDDLQYLQLFTEYGRLALKEGEQPFQKLLFLIRDWSYPYEFQYGAEGGEKLLLKILQENPEQQEEHREIRKHIFSSFESVKCFLMPHPGLTAASDPRFNGCFADLSDSFRTYLQEFVPWVLSEENLSVKRIGGEAVRVRDFVVYLRTFLDEFNSGNLPTPVSIGQAMAKATLLSAREEARRGYRADMAAVCGSGAPCLSPGALGRAHVSARNAALLILSSALSRTSISQEEREAQQALITQDLEALHPYYLSLNEEKAMNNISDSKNKYKESILKFSNLEDIEMLCLHPKDFTKAHALAENDAMSWFDSNRIAPEDSNDVEREKMLQELGILLKEAEHLNNTNSHNAVSEALETYSSIITEKCGDDPCMSRRELELKHDEALESALNVFKSKRNVPVEHSEDTYKSLLTKDIEQRFSRLLSNNDENNNMAVQAALRKYKMLTRRLWADGACGHVEHVRAESDVAHAAALAAFRDARTGESAGVPDNYEQQLLQELTAAHNSLERSNDINNNLAIKNAKKEYETLMKPISSSVFRNAELKVSAAHWDANKAANRTFTSKRRGPADHASGDKYQDLLRHEIESSYLAIREKNAKKHTMAETAEAIVGGAAAVLGFLLFRK